jgi:hypothetical protein
LELGAESRADAALSLELQALKLKLRASSLPKAKNFIDIQALKDL